MSVTIRHLNADSSFLLVFSPEAHPLPDDLRAGNGAFSILIDPWLVGSSIVSAQWFAITKRVVPSAIEHLSEIEEPDVVLVSQNKPDHCHKETLLQLRPEGKSILVTEPGAAKAIKSWNHFDPRRIYGLSKYDPKQRFGNLLRLRIPPLSLQGHPGEVTISFMPAKNYMTGLHNGFGITYQPPTHTMTAGSVSTIDLPRTTRYFHMPLSPQTLPPTSPPQPPTPQFVRPMSLDIPRDARPTIHQSHPSQSSNTASSDVLGNSDLDQNSTPDLRLYNNPVSDSPRVDLAFHFEMESHTEPYRSLNALPTPPDSPSTAERSSYHTRNLSTSWHQKSLSSTSSYPSLLSPVTPGRPKVLSVIYAPHGLPLDDLQPYIQNHLVRLPGALPLTVLLHAFDHAQNPWYLGGNIMTGATGGVKIARALMARCWLSAHDESKDDQGVSVKQLKIKKQSAEDVRRELWSGEEGEWLRQKGWTCDVRNLEVGKEMCIGQSRDLLAGMENKRETRLMNFGAG